MKCPIPEKWLKKLPWQFQTPAVHILVAAVAAIVVIIALIVCVETGICF
ncbi:hypothetical protein LCGC14_1069290 [marine sediment metagenome]|uniref:Uncharacterized protein n=1 Tax=marine sediment metagenome TaxID=412755 RepID=A0A0F9N5S4_9ZZZZ